MLYSPYKNEFDVFKTVRKGLPRKTIRISSLGANECFGLIEGYTNCPYSLFTITCKSKEAVLFRINNEELNTKIHIKTATAIQHNVQDKLILMYHRVMSTTKDLGINQEYANSDREFRHIKLPPENEPVNVVNQEEKEEGVAKDENDDEPIPVKRYVCIKKPTGKFKKNVRKLIMAKRISKPIVTDVKVQEHIEINK